MVRCKGYFFRLLDEINSLTVTQHITKPLPILCTSQRYFQICDVIAHVRRRQFVELIY